MAKVAQGRVPCLIPPLAATYVGRVEQHRTQSPSAADQRPQRPALRPPGPAAARRARRRGGRAVGRRRRSRRRGRPAARAAVRARLRRMPNPRLTGLGGGLFCAARDVRARLPRPAAVRRLRRRSYGVLFLLVVRADRAVGAGRRPGDRARRRADRLRRGLLPIDDGDGGFGGQPDGPGHRTRHCRRAGCTAGRSSPGSSRPCGRSG